MKKIFLILILILSFHSWINANEINEAFKHLAKGDVAHRFVIDMASMSE